MKQIIRILLFSIIPCIAFAVTSKGHSDPVAPVVLWVTFIFFFAILGRYFARLMDQPAVLGELLIGVLLGNLLYLFNVPLFIVLREGSAIYTIVQDLLEGDNLVQAVNSAIPNAFYAKQVAAALSSSNGTEFIKIGYMVDILSRYGVIFLLFMVGLDSSVDELKKTGVESFRVAVIGVAVPILLGYGVAMYMLPQSSYHINLFVAATLCATSIGITARVLRELKRLKTREAQTILGAAMIDDILGLIILAVVSSIVITGTVDLKEVMQIIIWAVLFFGGAIIVGPWALRRMVNFFSFLSLWEAKLFITFIFIMTLAWLATVVGLATIIGAFAAGLILHDGYFSNHAENSRPEFSIKNLASPLESILAPLFFVLIGIQVKLESFFHWQVILLAMALLIAAIVGKLVSGWGANRKDDRLLVGIGMMPRGEVGLVFASIGRTLGVISDELFSAIILMVIVTTVIAPPLIKARFKDYRRKRVHDN
ncbi:cation:proton antiporter [Legionella sp. W05-934-2]|jgi:Kef-type K+ transport system membrane component KefB|uniref:cation:proton antiporter n=1 Tax=Legionella sp. W05-934-2 TaxID=1198649 RepID=UPI0034635671